MPVSLSVIMDAFVPRVLHTINIGTVVSCDHYEIAVITKRDDGRLCACGTAHAQTCDFVVYCNSLGLPIIGFYLTQSPKLSVCLSCLSVLSVCLCLSVLSVCLTPLQRLRTYPFFFRNGSQRLTPIPRAAEIDSRHTYKQSGPTCGFDGALRLELRDPPAYPSQRS